MPERASLVMWRNIGGGEQGNGQMGVYNLGIDMDMSKLWIWSAQFLREAARRVEHRLAGWNSTFCLPPSGRRGGVAPGSLMLAAPQGKGREFSVALRVSWHHAILRVSTAGSPEQPQPCRPMNKA